MSSQTSDESLLEDVHRSRTIVIVDDFLPLGLYNSLSRLTSCEPMYYGSLSNSKTDPHGHWTKTFLPGNKHNLADLSPLLLDRDVAQPLAATWDFLRNKYFHNCALLRCYMNGYTYGTDGYFHVDSRRKDEFTAVLFLNELWEPDWAGELTFLDQTGDILKSVLPKKNRLVLFPSDMPHAGRSVSRKCTHLRKTLLFKARRKRSITFERLSEFLAKHGATKYRHEKGTLHDYLVRIFARLEECGAEKSVSLGGGLHAIYGTDQFTTAIMALTGREFVSAEFGNEAEELAYLFSIINRPNTLEYPLVLEETSAIVELRDGSQLKLSRAVFDNLRQIECAGLGDQNLLNGYANLSQMWSGILDRKMPSI